MAEHKTLTTAEGILVADNQNSLTAGDHKSGKSFSYYPNSYAARYR